jgi:hypothetical protein
MGEEGREGVNDRYATLKDVRGAVALYDARSTLAQRLLDYILGEPVGYAWVVKENGIGPGKNLVELTQLLNKCEEAGLVVNHVGGMGEAEGADQMSDAKIDEAPAGVE